jgi:hypothetical protein
LCWFQPWWETKLAVMFFFAIWWLFNRWSSKKASSWYTYALVCKHTQRCRKPMVSRSQHDLTVGFPHLCKRLQVLQLEMDGFWNAKTLGQERTAQEETTTRLDCWHQQGSNSDSDWALMLPTYCCSKKQHKLFADP